MWFDASRLYFTDLRMSKNEAGSKGVLKSNE
jgi:hypothetical protein